MGQLITVAVVQVLFLAGLFLWLQRRGLLEKIAPAMVPARMEEAVRLLEHTAQGVIAELEVRIAEARGLMEEWDRRLPSPPNRFESPTHDPKKNGKAPQARGIEPRGADSPHRITDSAVARDEVIPNGKSASPVDLLVGGGFKEPRAADSSQDAAARFVQALREFERAQRATSKASSRTNGKGPNGLRVSSAAANRSTGKRRRARG